MCRVISVTRQINRLKSIIGIQILCLNQDCQANGMIGASTLKNQLVDEPTLANIGQIATKFKCRECGSKEYAIFDESGSMMLFNSNQMKFCKVEGCGAAIPIPRWTSDPNANICVECQSAGEAVTLSKSDFPKVPIGKQTCPRCESKRRKKTPTTIYQNRKDGDYFLGCSSFPSCRWSEPL